jgi:hypothetical protein
MILTVLFVWMLLTFPLVRTTLKHLEEQNRPERNEVLFQIVLVFQSMIYVPHYYFLVTMELIVKLIKRK